MLMQSWIWIVAVIANAVAGSVAHEHQWSITSSGSNTEVPPLSDPDTSLFQSVYGRLKSWDQALSAIGWSVTPGYIPAGTLMYHGTTNRTAPESGMEWLAFDPEHAQFFALMESPKIGTLHTFIATRPLPILAFDGMSAAKLYTGVMDLQNAMIYGNDTARWTDSFTDEKVRGNKLCEWVTGLGFGGIVREETAFEVIWCDFSKDIKHVRGINFSVPRGDDDEDDLGHNSTTARLYAQARDWTLLNAQSSHFHKEEPHIILSPSHMTSLHDPKYISLESQYSLPNHQRRLLNLTNDEILHFKGDVSLAAEDWKTNNYDSKRPGSNFAGVIDGIVNRKTVQYRQMRSYVSEKNQTEGFQRVKFLAHGALAMYFDTAEALSSDVGRSVRHNLLQKGIEACKTSLAEYLVATTASEKRLKRAIEAVQERICEFDGSILLDASELDLHGVVVGQEGIRHSGLLPKWQIRLEGLMRWLDWSTWKTCQGGCGDDETCFIPMWPIDPDGVFNPMHQYPGQHKPKCLSWTHPAKFIPADHHTDPS